MDRNTSAQKIESFIFSCSLLYLIFSLFMQITSERTNSPEQNGKNNPGKGCKDVWRLILLVVRNILLYVNLPKSSAVEAEMFVFLQPDTDGTCIDWAVELNPGANFKRRSEKGQNHVSLRHKGILQVSNPLHWLHTEQQKSSSIVLPIGRKPN